MKTRSIIPFAILALAALLSAPGCEGGLSPESATDGTPGFGGEVVVLSNWPVRDSVVDMRVVAFRDYPPGNILSEIISGTAVFSDELEYGVSVQDYSIMAEGLNGVFEYVAVAQQTGPQLDKDWIVVGVYTLSGDPSLPSPIDLGNGQYLENISIDVDFENLPPQPF